MGREDKHMRFGGVLGTLAIIAAIVLPLSTLLAWWGLPHLGRSMTAAQQWIGNQSHN